MSESAATHLSYVVEPSPPIVFAQSPGSTLDYLFDFTDEFGLAGGSPGDSIVTIASVTAKPAGLTLSGITGAASGAGVILWASGGKLGQIYGITCVVITNFGRTYSVEGFLPIGRV